LFELLFVPAPQQNHDFDAFRRVAAPDELRTLDIGSLTSW
jgi:hypothetical protein